MESIPRARERENLKKKKLVKNLEKNEEKKL